MERKRSRDEDSLSNDSEGDSVDEQEERELLRQSKNEMKSSRLLKKQKRKRGRFEHARSSIANALQRTGSKSTKESTVEKPVRKTPGLLLETAGRSLLQKSGKISCGSTIRPNFFSGSSVGGATTSSSLFDSLNNSEGGINNSSTATTTAKLSFGLYGGHLPVDHGSYTKSTRSETALDSGASADSAVEQPPKRVFTNWGGEFFKKNLDYRANTNKILEKMNLGSSGKNSASSNGGDSLVAPAQVPAAASLTPSLTPMTTQLTSFIPGERFKALLGASKRPMESAAGNAVKSSKQSTHSPFLTNSYS